MRITCPQCGFSREMPADRLPEHTVIARCPKCACRFRLSPEQGVLETVTPGRAVVQAAPEQARPQQDCPEQVRPKSSRPDPSPVAGPQDDPLPPGAVIPDKVGSPRSFLRPGSDASGPRSTGESPQEEEEDIRLTASRAYEREAARAREEAARPLEDDAQDVRISFANPWEVAPGREGWLAAFYQTVMRVMFAAPRFFAGLNPQAAQMRALSFFLLVSVLQIVLERFWGHMLLAVLEPSAATDPQLKSMLEMLSPQNNLAMTVLMRTGMLVLQLYVVTALVHLAYRFVVPDRASFSLVFQVMAYSVAPSMLCIIPVLGSLAGMIWGMACMVVGCRAALRLSWGQTLMGFLPVLLVVIPMFLQIVQMMQA